MKVKRLAIGCLALTVAAQGRWQEPEIAVGFTNPEVVPFVLLVRAQATAARIYAGAGVKLRWRSQVATEIGIKFDAGVAAAVHVGAMGTPCPMVRPEPPSIYWSTAC